MHAHPNTATTAKASQKTIRLALIAPLAFTAALYTTTALSEQGGLISDGVTIQFTDEGEGAAVIFLHGFAGSSRMWPAIGLAPMDGFRTITFDARGHGESGKPETADSYGLEMVDDVLALMDARGVSEAHFVGYSMGAETALRLAVNHPDRVTSLVVAGSGWSGEEEAAGYGFVASALSEAETFGGFMAAMAPPDQDLPPEAMAAMGELLAAHGIDPAQPAAPLASVAAALPEIISLEASDLAAIAVPVLGIAGADDPEHDNVADLANAVPDFTFVSIAGADHLLAPVTPEFAAAISGFLAN